MSLNTVNEEYGKYNLRALDLASETEKLFVDYQAALSPTSDFSAASSESQAPSFAESPPPSEKSAEKDGGTKTSSRTSSAEYALPGSEVSSSGEDDFVVSQVELNGQTFDYHKINPALVPKGWSNNPENLEPVSRTLSPEDYSLEPFVISSLASETNGQTRYLFSIFGSFYFWAPATRELLYVTQSYDLRGILKRIDEHVAGLKTKTLEPLSHWYSEHQITHLPLWFWQIPRGWSQDEKGLREMKDLIDGQLYGLPLPIPIIVSDGREGGTDYFMKCGDRYYIFLEVSSILYKVEEPLELRKILRTLGDRHWKGLRLTECEILPAYGGPDKVPDDEVPHGWCNRIDQDLRDNEVFDRHDIRLPSLLLHCGSVYLVEGCDRFYLWDALSDDVSRILQPEALQDILDALKVSTEKLTLSKVECGRHSKVFMSNVGG